MSPDALPEPRHTEAAREVVTALMGVKGWLRQIHHWAASDRSNSAMLALATLERSGPIRVTALAELAGVDASVVSRQAAQLEHEGLVERHPDPDDGRAHTLCLTETGTRVLGQSRAKLGAVLADRLAAWQPEELEAFAATLRRLLEDLSGTTDTASTHHENPEETHR